MAIEKDRFAFENQVLEEIRTGKPKGSEAGKSDDADWERFRTLMENDSKFKSDTLMFTVSLIIQDIKGIKARLDILEEAILAIAEACHEESEGAE